MALPHIGSWGLPEFGITERLSNYFGQGRTAQGGSNLRGSINQTTLVPGNSVGSSGFVQATQPIRRTTNAVTTPQPIVNSGQTGGGGGTPTGGGSPQTYYENTPEFQQPDYDAMIQPALEGLNAQEPAAQSAYLANLSEADAVKAQRQGQLEAEYQTGVSQADRSRQRLSGQSENAVEEARRQFSEIQQGLQARYGGTTGSGAFVEGLAGRQTLQNIGQQRQALTQAISDVDNQLEQVRLYTGLAKDDVEYQATQAKSQAKAQLDNTIASIKLAKGELMTKKAELAQNAIQFYQKQVADINARNAAFNQQFALQQSQYEQSLALKRANLSQQVEKFNLVNLAAAGTQPQWAWSGSQSRSLTPARLGQGQLPGGYTGSDEDQNLVDQILPTS